jgi:hypothetical protein
MPCHFTFCLAWLFAEYGGFKTYCQPHSADKYSPIEGTWNEPGGLYEDVMVIKKMKSAKTSNRAESTLCFWLESTACGQMRFH